MTKTQQQSPTTQHISYLNNQSHRRNILSKDLNIFRKIEVAFNHWQNINLTKNTKNCIKQKQPHYVSPFFFLNSIPCFPKTRRQEKSLSMSSGRQRLLSIGRVKNTGNNDQFIAELHPRAKRASVGGAP